MIVIGEKYGQLGNQLWLFANFIAFSEEYGVKLVNPAFDEYAGYFQGTSGNFLCCYPPKRSRLAHFRTLSRFLYSCIHFMTRVVSRLPFRIPLLRSVTLWDELDVLDLREESFLRSAGARGVLLIRGWFFRDRRSLERHQESVRQFFRVCEDVDLPARKRVEAARNGAQLLIGVHIRQGDIKYWRAGDFYFETSEYVAMMRRLLDEFPEPVAFLVCSDQVQDKTEFEDLPVTLGPGDPMADMHALSLCDLIVGPPSTFTMWASFAGRTPLNVMSHPKNRITRERFVVWLDA